MASTLRKVPLIGVPGRVGEAQYHLCAPDNPDIPKGARTYNHIVSADMKAGVGRRMLAWRLQNEEVGNHFHPRVENKNPEVFEFLYGDVDVNLTDVYGDTRIIEVRIPLGEGPVLVTIPPYVIHSLTIRSAKALFEEFQSGPYDPASTYSAEEFALFAEGFR